MLLIHPISFEVILSFSCLVIFVCVVIWGTLWQCEFEDSQKLRILSLLFWDTVRRGEMREHWLLLSSTWHNHTQNHLYSLKEKQHWAIESPCFNPPALGDLNRKKWRRNAGGPTCLHRPLTGVVCAI